MPDKKDKVDPENQKPADLWDFINHDRRRKKMADDLKEGTQETPKNPQQNKNNLGEKKPPEDKKNDQP